MGVVANLSVRVTASISDVEKQFKSLENSFNRTGGRLQALGGQLTRSVTLPLAAIGAGAVRAASQFESSFAGVRKTVNATEAEFAALAQGFRDIAMATPINVNELNRIGELAGQLGIQKENILGFARVIADLGVTTNLSTEEAATSLARFANITQMSQTEFDKLGSTIVALGNNFATTERDIVEFGLRIAGAGETAGLTEANILAIGTAFSSVGIEAEAGGTAVQKVLLQMTEAAATGNDDLVKFAAAIGETSKGFQTMWSNDPAEAFTRFVETLGRASEADAFRILKDLGIDDQRQVRAFLSLANAGDILRRSVELSTQAWADNNALTREAAERYKTFESQVQLLWNRVYDLGIQLGQLLIPALERMMPSIEAVLRMMVALVDQFSRADPRVQTLALGFLALAAALGPVLMAAGILLKTFGALLGVMRTLGTVKALGALGAGAMGGWGVAALGALGYAGVKYAGTALGTYLSERGLDLSWLTEIGRGAGTLPPVARGQRTTDINLSNEKTQLDGVAEAVQAVDQAFAGLGMSGPNALGKTTAKTKELLETTNQLMWAQAAIGRPSLLNVTPGFDMGYLPWEREAVPLTAGWGGLEGLFAGGTREAGLPGFLQRTFGDVGSFAGRMSGTIMSAMTGGGNVGKSIGGMLGGDLFAGFAKSAAVQGLGQVMGGVLGSVLPGLGNILGSLAGGLFGKLFGGDAKKTRQMREEWIAQAGGIAKVKEMAEYAGVSVSKLLSTKKSKEFEKEVKKLEAAFAAAQERVKALLGDLEKVAQEGTLVSKELWQRLIADADKPEVKEAFVKFFKDQTRVIAEGFNTIATNWAALLDKGGETTELLNIPLERMGILAEAAFGAMLAGGATLVEALTALKPGLDSIVERLTATGMSASGTLAQLLGWQAIVEQNQELFNILAGVDQMLIGLSNTGLLTQETFGALAATVADAFNSLVAQGVAGDEALRLMQPQLQKLWELQQLWGFSIDETTQAMLDQALQQGIIGEQMKSVNDKILDVLVAIADVLGAKIPEGLRAMGAAATETANRMVGEFGRIRDASGGLVPLDSDGVPDVTGPQLASGGIVTQPTLATVGEAGPEAVVPLDTLESWINRVAASGTPREAVTLNVTIQAMDTQSMRDAVETQIVPLFTDVLRGNVRGARTATQLALGLSGG